MRIVALALLLSLWAAPILAETSPTTYLKDATYLRKMSFHLRGFAPDASEYQALKDAQASGAAAAFFEKKAAEYLRSPEHVKKMAFRLEELYRMKPGPSRLPGSPVPSPSSSVPYNDRNALNALFESIPRENLSWDTLLLGRSYRLFPKWDQDVLRLSDYAFYYALAPKAIPPPGKDTIPSGTTPTPLEIAFRDDDARVAGSITTPRFFSRYGTTELNKNRRRAAAVFDIFLCDSMAAAVPPPPSDRGPIADKAFPETSRITEDEIREIALRQDKHGADQACARCHYKLDPMGQAFLTSTMTLSTFPSAGRLVYKDRKTGVLVDRAGKGLGEIAKAITEQKAYVDCQVGYFWRWFIGSDRELTERRRAELVKAFDQNGRRANDFVAYLVRQPEFRQIDKRTPEQMRADGVKAVLKNCTSCHDSTMPDFTSWPIGGSSQSMKTWVRMIGERMDLANDGKSRTMPPADSSWQPSADEISKIKSWIDDGAPNENGDTQI